MNEKYRKIYDEGIQSLTSLQNSAPNTGEERQQYFYDKAYEFSQANAKVFASLQMGLSDSDKKKSIDNIPNFFESDLQSQTNLKKVKHLLLQYGGGNPEVSILPIIIKSKIFGIRQSFLFRVRSSGSDAHVFIDSNANFHSDIKKWKTSDTLPEGDIIFPTNGDFALNAKDQVPLSMAETPRKLDKKLLELAISKKESIASNIPTGTLYNDELNRQIDEFKKNNKLQRINYLQLKNLDIYKKPENYKSLYKTEDHLLEAQKKYLYQNSDEYAAAEMMIGLKTFKDADIKIDQAKIKGFLADSLRFKGKKQGNAGNSEGQIYSEGQNATLKLIQTSLKKIGGVNPEICVLPIVVKDPDIGVLSFPLFRVKNNTGYQFVDNIGRTYENFQNWRDDNKLPAGEYFAPKNGRLLADAHGQPIYETGKTPNDSKFNRYVMPALNGAAVAGGLAIVGVSIVATGGAAAAPWLLWGGGALASFGAINSGAALFDRYKHHQSINPASDADARSAWFGITGGMTGLAAIATSLRYANLLAKASVNQSGAQTVNVQANPWLTHRANVADQFVATTSIADYGSQMGLVYKNMTKEQLAAGGLMGLVIPSAMVAIGVKQSGGVGASFNPMRLPETYQINMAAGELGMGVNPSLGTLQPDALSDLSSSDLPIKVRAR